MNNSIQLENVGCLYTANKDGVQSYENTDIFIDNGLISSKEENKDYLTIDCKGKMVTSGFVDPVVLKKPSAQIVSVYSSLNGQPFSSTTAKRSPSGSVAKPTSALCLRTEFPNLIKFLARGSAPLEKTPF